MPLAVFPVCALADEEVSAGADAEPVLLLPPPLPLLPAYRAADSRSAPHFAARLLIAQQRQQQMQKRATTIAAADKKVKRKTTRSLATAATAAGSSPAPSFPTAISVLSPRLCAALLSPSAPLALTWRLRRGRLQPQRAQADGGTADGSARPATRGAARCCPVAARRPPSRPRSCPPPSPPPPLRLCCRLPARARHLPGAPAPPSLWTPSAPTSAPSPPRLALAPHCTAAGTGRQPSQAGEVAASSSGRRAGRRRRASGRETALRLLAAASPAF